MDSQGYHVPQESGQPGLEVGSDPHAATHTGWPQETKSGWENGTTEFSPTIRGTEGPAKRIMGLSIGMFWGIILLIAVLLAGGIGGGVGAGLASRKKGCESTTTVASGTCPSAQTISSTVSISATQANGPASVTSTTTTPAVSPAPTSRCSTETTFNDSSLTPLGADGNPIALGTTSQQTFKVFCNTNWPGGAAYGNPGLHDIMKIYQPDLLHCVAACAEYNAAYANNAAAGISVGGGYCKAVSLVLAPGEFCYLKNGTGLNDTSTSGGRKIDSAMLQ